MGSKIERYLEIVPLPVLIVVALAGIAVIISVPARWRLSLALIVMVPWMMVGRLTDMGLPAAIAKATGFGSFVLVALAAWLDPGPRRKLPWSAWFYPVTAVMGFVYVLTVTDTTLALATKLQWLLLVVAAMSVTRTIVDEESLQRVIRALTIGLVVALAVPLSALVHNPAEAFRGGLDRFFPFGANANQIGTIFAMTAPLAFYAAIKTRYGVWRPMWFGIGGLAIGMGLLTVSRSTVVVMMGALLPIALHLTRRPIFTIIGGIVVTGGLYLVFTMGQEARLGRLASLETERVAIAQQYLGVISERPLFGLLGTQGESFLKEETLTAHAHNAYLWLLYQGGISYAIPVIALAAYSGWCTFVVWRRRRELGADPLLIRVLIAFLVMVYAHGFVNGSIFYPTYAWAFFHILLATFFITLATDLRAGLPGALPSYYAEYDEPLPDYGEAQPEDDEAALPAV